MMLGRPRRRGNEREANVKRILGAVAMALATTVLAAACSRAPATAGARSPVSTGSAAIPTAQTVAADAVTSADLAPIDSQMQQLNGDLKSADDGMNSTQEGDVSR